MQNAQTATAWQVADWNTPVATFPTREEALAHIEQAMKAEYDGLTVTVHLDCMQCDDDDCALCEDAQNGGPGGPRQAFASTYSGKWMTRYELAPIV